MYMALPCSEYYQGVRLLLSLPPFLRLSYRIGRTRLGTTTGGLPSSVCMHFLPCHGLRPNQGLQYSRRLRVSTVAFRHFRRRRPLVYTVTRLNPFTMWLRPGHRPVYASPTASLPLTQDSVPCEWLALAGTGISPASIRQLCLPHRKMS